MGERTWGRVVSENQLDGLGGTSPRTLGEAMEWGERETPVGSGLWIVPCIGLAKHGSRFGRKALGQGETFWGGKSVTIQV